MSEHETYWRKQFQHETYYAKGRTYDDYAPAYRLGYESRGRYAGKRFEEVERELERSYVAMPGSSKLAWADAMPASRAAWDRAGNGATSTVAPGMTSTSS